MNESEVLLDVAVLGEQVSQFLSSDVGRYVLEHAEAEASEGVTILKSANPYDSIVIQSAQNKVWRAESVKQWLEGAVMAGLKARAILEDREE